jgi:hypothetical protein
VQERPGRRHRPRHGLQRDRGPECQPVHHPAVRLLCKPNPPCFRRGGALLRPAYQRHYGQHRSRRRRRHQPGRCGPGQCQ